MDNASSDRYAPSIRYVPAPEENRTPPADYKENFDRNYAEETARALTEYLASYAAENGSDAAWTRSGAEVNGVAPSGAKFAIRVYLHDAFDMDYWPAPDGVTPSENGMVLMHMMPGFDRDHMVAWARHFSMNGRFD